MPKFLHIDWERLVADALDEPHEPKRGVDSAALNPAIELPICDVCNKPVDSVQRDMAIPTREYLFTVRCHGQVEQFKVDQKLLMVADSIGIGRAFVRKGISEQPKPMLESKR